MGTRLTVLAAAGCLLWGAAAAAADPAPAGMFVLKPAAAGAPSQLVMDAEGPGGGFLAGQVPSGMAFWLAKGFVLNPAAVPGVCTNDQAKNNSCPASSQFAAGTIDVAISGLINQSTTATVGLFVGAPQQTGDPAGAVFSFSVPAFGASGASVGRIVNTTDAVYGTELLFTQLPIPGIPPGLTITLKNFKLTTLAPSGTLPKATPTPTAKKKQRKHKKHRRKRRRKKAHKAAAPFLTNPTTCSGAWALRLQVFYGASTQDRVAAVPCTS